MPQYTFECSKCGKTEVIYRPFHCTDGRTRLKCPDCNRRLMRRIFEPPNVMPDEFIPVNTVALRTVHGDPRGYDTVSSRSEMKRNMQKHDAMYGTKLEQP